MVIFAPSGVLVFLTLTSTSFDRMYFPGVSDSPPQYAALELHYLGSTIPVELPTLLCTDQALSCVATAPHVPVSAVAPHVPAPATVAPP
ncbi:hypothetical protein LWI28_026731 [Acer negundo]|uniref:Secreted protein n=1 Tax=Acer negundo TaxID=4023 RepID=A0AAD5IGI3_ACENE|nr:hypothetical protein LWI28_026731 [Acer negundo]